MTLEIVKYPNSILKNTSFPVVTVGKEERQMLEQMIRTMYFNGGIGLAAPQIGINKQLAVIDIGDKKLLKLINPTVIEVEGKEEMEEGCLSIPNVYINVKRPKRVKIKALDENGREFIMEATGLLGRAILHEIDHLKGRIIIDYLNPIKRFIILKKNYKLLR